MGASGSSIVVIILSVVAIGIGAYAFYMSTTKADKSSVSAIASKVTASETQLETVKQRLLVVSSATGAINVSQTTDVYDVIGPYSVTSPPSVTIPSTISNGKEFWVLNRSGGVINVITGSGITFVAGVGATETNTVLAVPDNTSRKFLVATVGLVKNVLVLV